MKVLKVQKAQIFYVETDEPLWYNYIRDENRQWRCLNNPTVQIDGKKQKELEDAYIDYAERTFNGCS